MLLSTLEFHVYLVVQVLQNSPFCHTSYHSKDSLLLIITCFRHSQSPFMYSISSFIYCYLAVYERTHRFFCKSISLPENASPSWKTDWPGCRNRKRRRGRAQYQFMSSNREMMEACIRISQRHIATTVSLQRIRETIALEKSRELRGKRNAVKCSAKTGERRQVLGIECVA